MRSLLSLRRTASLAVLFTAVTGLEASDRLLPASRAKAAAAAQEQGPTPREFTVTARKYRYSPPRIEVFQDDLVKITLKTEDIPHSFTIDAYRIAKRASAGQPVVFEFRADQIGAFPIYCSLAADEGCRQMRAELVVKKR